MIYRDDKPYSNNFPDPEQEPTKRANYNEPSIKQSGASNTNSIDYNNTDLTPMASIENMRSRKANMIQDDQQTDGDTREISRMASLEEMPSPESNKMQNN